MQLTWVTLRYVQTDSSFTVAQSHVEFYSNWKWRTPQNVWFEFSTSCGITCICFCNLKKRLQKMTQKNDTHTWTLNSIKKEVWSSHKILIAPEVHWRPARKRRYQHGRVRGARLCLLGQCLYTPAPVSVPRDCRMRLEACVGEPVPSCAALFYLLGLFNQTFDAHPSYYLSGLHYCGQLYVHRDT